tara:strand:+ start:1789 stop:2967 length:1179 start_codon:yes stop_codon:yes gene_type:complete
MKYKLSLLIDSLLSSGANFLITFLLLKYEGNESVVMFGVAMTLSLIFLSFQRTIVLIPFNLKEDKCSKVRIIEFLSCSFFLLVLFLVLIFISTYFVFPYQEQWLLAPVLFAFLFIHESFRYLFMVSKLYFLPALVSVVLVSTFAASLLFDGLSIKLLINTYSCLFALELIVVSLFITFKKANTDEHELDIFFWFRDTRNLLNRNVQSISQLLLVHSPFLVVSALYPATVSSVLFIVRSVFQPVQILIKSVEAIDQRKLASIKDNANIFVKSLFKKYMLISLAASLICLLIAVYLFPVVYGEQAVPKLGDLLFWAGILVCLSCSRSVEMLLVKKNMYKKMNSLYLLSGLGVLSLLLLNLFLHLQVSPSLNIFMGWLFLAITYYLIVMKGVDNE